MYCKKAFMMVFFFFFFILIPDEVCGEEDHEDSEYNFMAEDQKEEKEEYRNDRAVRIPRKLCSSFSQEPSFCLNLFWLKKTQKKRIGLMEEDGQKEIWN